ncbi:hypothetical protein [Thomasclavelia cocleata]|uniref:hypothetical protein n=1 Tax=Thomasclavelia cocleata TaxID=69824 RepID=UPI0024308CCC|nr:hypothetical protein [Thomasclavelia cocleata]
MKYISIEEAGIKYNLTPELIYEQCEKGFIMGAIKIGTNWMIPNDLNYLNSNNKLLSIPRKCPFLIMTDLYNSPGYGDELIKKYENVQPEAALLLKAQLMYFRGDFEEAYQLVQYCLLNKTCFELQIGIGLVLSLCAMYKGDVYMWNEAKQYIMSTPCQNENEQLLLVSFWLMTNESNLYNDTNF